MSEDPLSQETAAGIYLLARLSPVLEATRARAGELDDACAFPTDDIAALRSAGALRAVLPASHGGLGIGTEPAQARVTAKILHRIGGGSIALGRLYEAHLNAVRLVMRYAAPEQREAAAADVQAGHLYALWATEGPDGLRYAETESGIRLQGQKMFCSAAGHATRAVVTGRDPKGRVRLLVLALGRGEKIGALASGLQGVRSATTGRVDFTGTDHAASAVFGAPGDYLREPDFSAGAWRTSAVTAGALTALVQAVRAELVARDRASDPHQLERLGRMLIHAETANLWLANVADVAESVGDDPAHVAASVNLARIAIEAACLETIPLVQRSLGLSAFMRGSPVERMCRDLATYLRQPAPDETLHDAAAHFVSHPATCFG